MAEILGIGCPHGPHMRFTDETMANVYFRINLRNAKTPRGPQGSEELAGEDESGMGERRRSVCCAATP